MSNFDPNSQPSPMPEGTVVSEQPIGTQPFGGTPFKFHQPGEIAEADKLKKALDSFQDTSGFDDKVRITMCEARLAVIEGILRAMGAS